MKTINVLSVSGGKDSTAMYLLALEQGIEFQAVFADTGNEHPYTLDYVRELPVKTGGPPIKWVAADFSEDQFQTRRTYVRQHWQEKHGVDSGKLEDVCRALSRSGNPFLDLCLMKARFPSTRRRFCSEFLKHIPIMKNIIAPIIDKGQQVVSWRGVRAQESKARAKEPVRKMEGEIAVYHPILDWTIGQVIDRHRRHGLILNPLYNLGFKRVGCCPCIHARKHEILAIAQRFPEEIDRIADWEAKVSLASPRGQSTFFAKDKTPGADPESIRAVVDWSKTSRGGREAAWYKLLPPPRCESEWGLCE